MYPFVVCVSSNTRSAAFTARITGTHTLAIDAEILIARIAIQADAEVDLPLALIGAELRHHRKQRILCLRLQRAEQTWMHGLDMRLRHSKAP
jgi:hypothetical protein